MISARTRILVNLKLYDITAVPVRTSSAVNLSYRVSGHKDAVDPSKTPLIICHGLLGTRKVWKGVAKTILTMTKRVVVTVDLRNHGASPQTPTHRYEDQASDVLRLMKKLELKKVCMMGYGMGARVAMCVSLMKPSSVAGLIAVEMSPASTSPEFIDYYPKLMAAMAKVEWRDKKKVWKARKQVRKQLKQIVTDDALMKSVLSNFHVKTDETIGWLCNLEVLQKEFMYITRFPRALAKKHYDGPAIFIGGQLSESIPADDLPMIRAIFPRTVVRYVIGANHNVHVDDPASFMELLINFLREI